MATPNTDPIWTRQGNVGSALLTAANTTSQGAGTIGTDIFVAFTADATNGGYVESLRLVPTASAANATTTAAVFRIFVSSKASGSTTSADTFLVAEVYAPSYTAAPSTSGNNPIDVALGFALPPGWTILVTTHTVPATNTAWRATTFGGNY